MVRLVPSLEMLKARNGCGVGSSVDVGISKLSVSVPPSESASTAWIGVT